MNRIDKIKNKVQNLLKNKLLYYIIAIILFSITYYIDFSEKLTNQNIVNQNHLKYFSIISVIILFIIIFLSFISKKLDKKLEIHILYFIIAIIIGVIYLFIIPLCAQSDEPAHIYRALQIAHGEVISPQNESGYVTNLPKSFADVVNVNSEVKIREYKKYYDIKEMMRIELNKDEKVELSTVGSYNAISYIPQLPGLLIGLMLNLKPYFILMLGRITSLIITILLFTLGIKKLPSHKLFATIILLSPVVLSTAPCFSADNITLASIFLLISYVLYYKKSKKRIKRLDYAIFTILTIFVALAKIAYLPIIGILLILPKECFENKNKRKNIFCTILLVIGIISTIWWMNVAKINPTTEGLTSTNTWIYSNPFSYFIIVFRTTISNVYDYIANMFAGHFLCHNQINTYEIVPLAYIVIVVISFFTDKNTEEFKLMQKIIILGIILLSFALIHTAIYVYNTSYKNNIIIGVQGRYLVPLLFLLILFSNNKYVIKMEKSNLINIAIIANFVIYLSMLSRFFI